MRIYEARKPRLVVNATEFIEGKTGAAIQVKTLGKKSKFSQFVFVFMVNSNDTQPYVVLPLTKENLLYYFYEQGAYNFHIKLDFIYSGPDLFLDSRCNESFSGGACETAPTFVKDALIDCIIEKKNGTLHLHD